MLTTLDELKRLHMQTCRRERDRTAEDLAAYRATRRIGTGTGRHHVDMTSELIASLDVEISQYDALIRQYERELPAA